MTHAFPPSPDHAHNLTVYATFELSVREPPAFKKPDPGGVNFEFLITEGSGTLAANHGGAPLGSRSGPRLEITQRSLFPPLVAIFLAVLFL